MNSKKAKQLRRQVAGDPDMVGRVFADKDNVTTHLLHPTSHRKQYQLAKREDGRWKQ